VAVRAVRGAIQLETGTAEAVQSGAMRLVREVMDRNMLSPDDLISVLFTNTPDLVGTSRPTVRGWPGWSRCR